MRRVCGCTPTSSAATLMMYTARSPSLRSSRPFASLRSSISALHSEMLPGRVTFDRLQLLQKLLLLAGQLRGHLDPHGGEEVPMAALLRLRGALAPDPKRPPARGARGDLQRHR